MSTRPFAHVIGDPIAQSKSPMIHGFWLEKLGIEADYFAERVPEGKLAAYCERYLKDPQWLGCNVTMPLKHEALARGILPIQRQSGSVRPTRWFAATRGSARTTLTQRVFSNPSASNSPRSTIFAWRAFWELAERRGLS